MTRTTKNTYVPTPSRVRTVAKLVKSGIKLATSLRAQMVAERKAHQAVPVQQLKRKFNKAVLAQTGFNTGTAAYNVVKSTLSTQWGMVVGKVQSKVTKLVRRDRKAQPTNNDGVNYLMQHYNTRQLREIADLLAIVVEL